MLIWCLCCIPQRSIICKNAFFTNPYRYQQMRFLCEAYEQYSQGLLEAEHLYSDLCHYKEFQDFLQRIPADQNLLSLEDFLHKPTSHVTDLLLHLQTILALTEESHPDYKTLFNVVLGMYISLCKPYKLLICLNLNLIEANVSQLCIHSFLFAFSHHKLLP